MATPRTARGPITDYTPFFSRRCLRRKPSAIRVLNPIARREGMISLGGGNPNPETFPFESMQLKMRDGTQIDVAKDSLYQGLEYGPSSGLTSLVNVLKQHQTRYHSPLKNPDWDIIITSGSQDAINIVFDMLLNEGDSLFVESPTYSGTLAALAPLACKLVGIDCDEHGLIPKSLQDKINNWDSSIPFPKLLYTIPTGQNPSGSTTTLDRKKQIYEIACNYNLLILEDDPYYFLSFAEGTNASYFSMDVEGRVIRFDSLSKILAAGLRIGWATGPAPLLHKMELHQQAWALHTSGLSQLVAFRVLDKWGAEGFDAHVKKVQDFYKNKRDTFVALLDTHLKGLAEWSVPVAGMFVYIKCLGIKDTRSLIMEKAVEKKVLLVPGQSFMPNDEVTQYARASYSTATKEQMEEAVQRLAALLRDNKQ